MFASVRDVYKYVGPDGLTGRFILPLHAADMWVRQRVQLNGHVPPAVREATALLAAVYMDDEDAMTDESRIPNMVRVMLIPWQ